MTAPEEIERLLRQLNEEFVGWKNPPQRLAQILERDELALYAQPMLALREPRTFAMAEVLVRLRGDDEMLLPPNGFLPLFAHFGMAPQLDRWVARQALAQLGQRPKVNVLFINISTPTLADGEFIGSVAAEAKRAGIAASSLVFEIAEPDLIDRADAVAEFAQAARAAGFRIALQGFGRRSVTLAPLRDLRIDFVKVEGIIVRTLGSSPASRDKFGAIVQFANALGCGVIAECVERPESVAEVEKAGAQFAQGFGVQVPAPIRLIIGSA